MTYTNYYLKGIDKEEVESVLLSAGLLQEIDSEVFPVSGVDVHHVGVIFEGGEWDEEGNEVVAPIIIPGWHTNLRTSLVVDESLLTSILIVPPSTPICVWAE